MRAILFTLGCVTLGVMWWGPLAELATHVFFAHMIVHMGVVAVAAPLLAIGIAGSRFDPVPRAPRFFAAVPVSMLELVVVWAWHAPQLHAAARQTPLGTLYEQSSFLFCGLWLWLSAFGGTQPRGGSRTAAGVVGLLLTSMHMTLLGALLALSPRTLYPHAESWRGLTPLDDQHLGGAIMLLGGGISYFVGGLWLTLELLRSRVAEPESCR